jgi:exo-beta-1,3-glucanase (GH17 family)
MKKIFLPLLVIAASLSITSCHKERTCTCNYTTVSTFGSTSQTTTSSSVDTWENASKHEAGSNCISSKSTTSFTGGSSETTGDCKLN